MFFYPYLCSRFRNLQDVQLLKQKQKYGRINETNQTFTHHPFRGFGCHCTRGCENCLQWWKEIGRLYLRHY